MSAREGLGREGMPGPEREEGEGVLEVAVISRDGTDRQRADYRARPLTFPELHVTAATGLVGAQPLAAPRGSALPAGQTPSSTASSKPPMCEKAALAQRRDGKKKLTLQDKRRKGRFKFFTKTYQLA